MKQLQFEKEILNNTKSQCVKESSTFANVAAMKQLQLDVLKNTKSKCMKESNILVYFVNMKQLQIDHLQNTREILLLQTLQL